MSFLYVHLSTSDCLSIYIYLPQIPHQKMMLSGAYPRFLSPTLAYPASWHVSVPIVLLFLFLISSHFVFTPLVRVRA